MSDSRKIQSTYRAGAKTPDIIKDAVEQGTEAAGSFSKFVDSLIMENKALGGTMGEADPEAFIADAVPSTAPTAVDLSAVEEKLTAIEGSNAETKSAILEAISNIVVAPSTDATSEQVSVSLPDDIVTKNDLDNAVDAIKAEIARVSAESLDKNIAHIDEVISEMQKAFQSLPADAEEKEVVEIPEETQVAETIEVSEDAFGSSEQAALFLAGFDSLVNGIVSQSDDEDVDINEILDEISEDEMNIVEEVPVVSEKPSFKPTEKRPHKDFFATSDEFNKIFEMDVPEEDTQLKPENDEIEELPAEASDEQEPETTLDSILSDTELDIEVSEDDGDIFDSAMNDSRVLDGFNALFN